MEMVLSHVSALQFLRTPPVVHQMYGSYPDISSRASKFALQKLHDPYGAVVLPLHVLMCDQGGTYRGKACVVHRWRGGLPPGAVLETEWGVSVASPLFAIQCLSSALSVAQTTMLLYEMTGTFAVFRPTAEIRLRLQRLIDDGALPIVGGWRPMLGTDGRLGDLWARPPLADLEELRRYAKEIGGMRGAKQLASAVRDVHGIAASPFEVQTAMLLGLPKSRGGYGLGPFEHNKRIALWGRARAFTHREVCFGDLYAEGAEGCQPVLIECQGNAYHGDFDARDDDNRAMALQSMGITVVRLRQDQIAEPARLRNTAGYIGELMGKTATKHTQRQHKKLACLQADVLSDWWRIGT